MRMQRERDIRERRTKRRLHEAMLGRLCLELKDQARLRREKSLGHGYKRNGDLMLRKTVLRANVNWCLPATISQSSSRISTSDDLNCIPAKVVTPLVAIVHQKTGAPEKP